MEPSAADVATGATIVVVRVCVDLTAICVNAIAIGKAALTHKRSRRRRRCRRWVHDEIHRVGYDPAGIHYHNGICSGRRNVSSDYLRIDAHAAAKGGDFVLSVETNHGVLIKVTAADEHLERLVGNPAGRGAT